MSRARLLHVLSILQTETNVSCGLTLQEICQILFKRHPEELCSEQRVRDDISTLQVISEENLIWTIYYYAKRTTGGVTNTLDNVVCGIVGLVCIFIIFFNIARYIKNKQNKN